MAEIVQDQPAVEPTPEAVQTADAAPLSEHIEQFHLEKPEEAEPAQPQKRERHRSAKNFARAEDVPRIKELTRELNEWKTKYEEASKPREVAPTPQYQPPKPSAAPSDFTDPEPTLDKWLADGKDYDRYLRDAAAWDRKKESYDGSSRQTVDRPAPAV